MFCVFRTIAGALRRLVAEEIGVRLALPLTVSLIPIGVGAQHEGEQVLRDGTEDRVGLRQCPGWVAARQVDQADVIAGVDIEGRELAVGAESHGKEEGYAV